jgi:hypothetical protein
MKDQMLKIAKVKSEKEFYKKYPTEEAFMKAHGKAFKKAAMGSQMVNDQLHQLTDFGNPPIAQKGIGMGMTSNPQDFTKYFQGTNQSGLNPDGTIKQVGDAFNNAAMAQMSGQQMASNMSSQFATPSSDKLLGANDINKGAGTSSSGVGAMDMGMAALGALPGIIGGIEAIGAQKKTKKKAEQNTQLSGLALQAQNTAQAPKRKYVRPEDNIIQPGQFGNPYGSGTNFLAENGTRIGGNPTEIQNMYNPGDMYTDLGFEPLGETLKQFKHGGGVHKAELGEYFQDSGQAQIGSAVGQAAGNLIGGPLGGMIGGFVGKIGGNLLGGAKQARQLQAEQDRASMNNAQLAFGQSNQFGAYMEQGGKVDVGDEYKWVSHTWQPQTITKFGEYNVKDLLKPPHDADMLRSGGHLKDEYYTPPSAEAMFTGRPELQPLTMEQGGKMALGGELQIGEGGYAETLSYNPNLPGGEIGMFRGASHDNGGIQTQYGENGVEVEGGEPFTILENYDSQNGSSLEEGGANKNLTVFGNIKINKNIADLMGDSKAKGKKFKHYVADIAKNDAKQLKTISKADEEIINADNNSTAGHLKLITNELIKQGAEEYQKINAKKIQEAGIVQNAILDTASQLGVKSDRLAEGKIEKEKDPRMMAQNGFVGGPLTPEQRLRTEGPGGTLYEGAKHYVTERGQLPLFARMLGAKPKPQYFNAEMTNTLMNADDRSYMVNKPYNEDMTNQLMYASRNNAPFNNALNTSLLFGTPYTQVSPAPVATASSVQTEPMLVANTPISQTPTSNKKGKSTAKSSKMPTNKGPLDASVIKQLYSARSLPGAPQELPVGISPLDLQPVGNLMQNSEDESLSFGQRALGSLKSLGKGLGKGIDKYGATALSYAAPFLRPSNANEALPPDQLYPEYFAMATNQLEPVQAQTFQPMLDTPMDISLNDQLNAIDSQSRAAIRAAGQNPSAQAMIMAQALEAKNKVLGEQTRINAANKMQTFDKNRALVNDAKLRNLQILDQQYVRQAQAKSNTREQTFNALSSIAAKTAQQRAANRKLAVMENMYGFRFTPSGRAINVNAPAQFNTSSFASNSDKGLASGLEYTYDSKGNIIGTRKAPASSKASINELDDTFAKNGAKASKKNARNSSIVKALKNL